jgi:hypothetical protein
MKAKSQALVYRGKSHKSNPQKLIEDAGKVGIINISTAKRGVSEHIIRDAIETTKFLNNYFDEHPGKILLSYT